MMTEVIGGNLTNKSSHFQVKSSLQLRRSQLRKLCMTLMLNVYIIVHVIASSPGPSPPEERPGTH